VLYNRLPPRVRYSRANTWPSKVRQPLKPVHIQLGNLHLREVYPILPCPLFQFSHFSTTSPFFTSRVNSRSTMRQFLAEAAHGFVQKLTVPRSSYEQLWSTKSNIFEQSKIGHISRTRRLHEGRRKIKQGSKEYDCAGRFALLFLRHDIDETVASLKDITLRQGKKKATVAYERIARDLSTTVKALKSDKAHSRHYLSLLTKSGPGDLLELGDNVSNLWACNTRTVCSNN